MPYSLSENWDGVSPPSIPAGWNVDAPYVTSTTNFYSSPNALKVGTVSAGTKYYATYATLDPGGGASVDVTSLIYVDGAAGMGDYFAGPTFRCSSATMDNSTTSCYWVRLWFNPGTSYTNLRFSSVVNGAVTDLYTAYSVSNEIVPGRWFSVRVVSYGGDVFSVILTRLSDGFTLDASGNFVATSSTAIQSYHATAIPSGGYSGLAAASFDGGRIYFDDINVSTSGTVVVPPRRPVIARIPFQYFITD